VNTQAPLVGRAECGAGDIEHHRRLRVHWGLSLVSTTTNDAA